MKKFQALLLLISLISFSNAFSQTDKSKRPSPPAKVTETISSGAMVSIDYSQPSVKGRVIGETLEPMKGKIWRMGANEATVFETNKDLKINGQTLPAGKYSIFGLWADEGFSVIFNKDSGFWGTQYEQHKTNDLLKIPAKVSESSTPSETLNYTISKGGLVSLNWGSKTISFNVQ